tara:strand:- start:59 stop:556 length:498 start_codon:yes stop_codon:yes gene_type:complete
MRVRLLLIYVLLLTTACGFHLRGSQTAKINIDNLYINSASASSLAKEVKLQLSGTGNALADSAQNASFVITIKEESFEKSVLSVSPKTGKVEEYQMLLHAKMDLIKADGTFLLEDEKLTVIRDFAFDENAVLGEFAEESIIQEDLIRRAANQVIRRLQALISSSK